MTDTIVAVSYDELNAKITEYRDRMMTARGRTVDPTEHARMAGCIQAFDAVKEMMGAIAYTAYAPGVQPDPLPDNVTAVVDAAAAAITSAAADGRTIASPTSAAMALLQAGLLNVPAPDPAMSADEMSNCIVVTGAIWGALMGMPATKSVEPEANTLLLRLDFMGSPYRITVTRESEMF